jgi:hypothetical protein
MDPPNPLAITRIHRRMAAPEAAFSAARGHPPTIDAQRPLLPRRLAGPLDLPAAHAMLARRLFLNPWEFESLPWSGLSFRMPASCTPGTGIDMESPWDRPPA